MPPSTLKLPSGNTNTTMPTFTENLYAASDECETISFYLAARFANAHDLSEHFWQEYRHMAGERVDTGEFLTFLGY